MASQCLLVLLNTVATNVQHDKPADHQVFTAAPMTVFSKLKTVFMVFIQNIKVEERQSTVVCVNATCMLPTCYLLFACVFQHVSFEMDLKVNPWFCKVVSSRDAAIWPSSHQHTSTAVLTSSPKTQSRTWWGVDTSVTSCKMGWLLWWTKTPAIPFLI